MAGWNNGTTRPPGSGDQLPSWFKPQPTVARTGYNHFGGGPTGGPAQTYTGTAPAGAPGDPNRPSISRTGAAHFTDGPWTPNPQKYNGAPPPGAPGSTLAAATPTYGSESGPTTIENWFNQRASGTDPAWEYETGRATDAINKQYAARGGYNSSGAMNSLDDMFANAVSQREGQLDTLANESTTAHQNKLDSMFGLGNSIANGASGAGLPYAQGAGGAMSQDQINQITLQLTKAGVDQKTRQAILNTLMSVGKGGATVAGGS